MKNNQDGTRLLMCTTSCQKAIKQCLQHYNDMLLNLNVPVLFIACWLQITLSHSFCENESGPFTSFSLPVVPGALPVDGAGGPLQGLVSWFCNAYSACCCSTKLLQCKAGNRNQWSKVLESSFKQLCDPAPLVRHFPMNSFPSISSETPLPSSEPGLCPLQ